MATDDLRAKIAEALCADAHEPPRAVPNAAEPRHRIGACYEHIRGADAVLAVVQPELDRLARVEALMEKRDVLYPPKFGRTPSENYVTGYRAAKADFRAALRTPDGGSDAD